MSKKYVYLKTSNLGSPTLPRDSLAELELTSLSADLKQLTTIFQLSDITDLKQIILKSEVLQKRLSQELPANGSHGYLWYGDNLPAGLEAFLYRTRLFDSCYIFQRNTDPVPTLIKSALGKIADKIEIYNWWVYILPFYHRMYRHVTGLRLHKSGKAPFASRFDVCLQDPFAAPDCAAPDDASLLFCPISDRSVLQHVLLDSLPQPVAIHNSMTTGDVFQNLVLSTRSIRKREPGIKDIWSGLTEVGYEEFRKQSEAFLSSMRLLLASRGAAQTDLFSDPLSDDFRSVWQREKDRLQPFKSGLSEANQKSVVVARFLLDRNKSNYSNLIELALQTALRKLLKRPSGPDLLTLLKNALYALEEDLLAVEALRALVPNGRFNTINQNTEPAGLLFYPSAGFVAKPEKWRITLSRLMDKYDGLVPDDEFDVQVIWHDQIGIQGPLFLESGNSGRYLFNRLYSQNLEHEAVVLFWHWMQFYKTINSATDHTTSLREICLILPHVMVQEKHLSISELIEEYLKRSENGFQLIKKITDIRLDQSAYYDVLILTKESS